ncbi:hypothetical protein I546_0354 [Mycobacterium kansasii 732]|uniref:Uncharacterized protein n=1 Tax=Mycobacterium kansasii TaxID=1768 RepID=A0A1V3WK94_MYCKA|nr:hypothetical protein I546_0354 [Mycobacterium kansasii 732]OOK67380.1 hypothetical protein BZL30_7811 [Mycobacterium kansasii]
MRWTRINSVFICHAFGDAQACRRDRCEILFPQLNGLL